MIFSSFRFLVFFPVVLLLYHACRNLRYRQWLLLVASYVFYASWDPRFLGLIVFSTAVDYMVGLRLPAARTTRARKTWLSVSLAANLGVLGFFKYFNFFIDSFRQMLGWVGVSVDPAQALNAGLGLPYDASTGLLDLVLPVGISFYTFQTMSYSLDIYRGRLQPTRDPVRFALFVAFFPQLVAGPIVRAVELLPQLARRVGVDWDDVSSGLNRFAMGFTKKVFIADNVAPFVDRVFGDAGSFDGVTLWLASIGFAVQCYCDFSGYSDMAIGTGRLMGFRLPENFRFPFTAVNVADFWRRWHITLYSFMRDYLYFALGGSRVGPARLILNAMITMTLVGFWHGADWQFVVWGIYNGLLIVGHRILGIGLGTMPRAQRLLESLPGVAFRIAATNVLFFVSFCIFRSESASAAGRALWSMFRFDTAGTRLFDPWILAAFGVVLVANVAAEQWSRRREALAADGQAANGQGPDGQGPDGQTAGGQTPAVSASRAGLAPAWQSLGYVLLLTALVLYAPSDTQAFVYFQF